MTAGCWGLALGLAAYPRAASGGGRSPSLGSDAIGTSCDSDFFRCQSCAFSRSQWLAELVERMVERNKKAPWKALVCLLSGGGGVCQGPHVCWGFGSVAVSPPVCPPQRKVQGAEAACDRCGRAAIGGKAMGA